MKQKVEPSDPDLPFSGIITFRPIHAIYAEHHALQYWTPRPFSRPIQALVEAAAAGNLYAEVEADDASTWEESCVN
jgi:hypothetical protein